MAGISHQDFWHDLTTEFLNGLIDRHNRSIQQQIREQERASKRGR